MNKNNWKNYLSSQPYNYQAVLSFRSLRGNPKLRAAEHAEHFYRAINNQVLGKRWEAHGREASRIHVAAVLEREDLNCHLQTALQVPERAMARFEASIKPVWCRKTREMFSTSLACEDVPSFQQARQLKIDNERGNCVWGRLPSRSDSDRYVAYLFKEQRADEKLWFSGFSPSDISYNFPGSSEAGCERLEGPRDL